MKILNTLYAMLVGFLNSHRAFIVRYFGLNYESKILGKPGESGKYLRVVLPTLLCFFLAIFATLIIDSFNLWAPIQNINFVLKMLLSTILVLFYLIFWIPVLVCWWIGFPWFKEGYFDRFPIKYGELKSNSQQWQMINKPYTIGNKDETFPTGQYRNKEYTRLKMWNVDIYAGSTSVHAWLGLAPFLITGLGFYIAYLLFQL